MKVDAEVLRMFAEYLRGAGTSLAELNVLGPFADVEAALPGTDFRAIVAAAAGATTSSVLGMSERLTAVAGIAAGVADTYDTTEEDFVAKLRSMDVVR